MTFSIRRMHEGDLDQVRDIDMDAFPSQWPVPNYKQELSNKLAYYIVLSDDNRRTEPAAPEQPRHTDPSLLDRILPWRKTDSHKRTIPVQSTPDYLVGFSGIWLLVGEAHITNIAVRGDYRGRGLGGHRRHRGQPDRYR